MSDAAKHELQALVREAVTEALRDHPCRFTPGEAAALHSVAKLSDDQLTALSLASRALNSAAARIGTLLVYGLLAACVAGLAWAIRAGLIDVE